MSEQEQQFELAAPDASRWIVLKFGGSSVASADNWQRIAACMRQRQADGHQVLVVHSALKGVSNALQSALQHAVDGESDQAVSAIERQHVQLAEALGIDGAGLIASDLDEVRQLLAGIRLIREVTPRIEARVMALGEMMASRLSYAFLSACELTVAWHDARTLLTSEREIRERRHYLRAVCSAAPDPTLQVRLGAGALHLTQGFIAADQDGDTVLLGRGGSDTSAAYFGAQLQAHRVEVWTDVPGLFSTDPTVVPAARLLKRLHYSEAQEIASAGGQVLHPRSIAPLWQHAIPMYVLCTSRPELPGTVIAEFSGEVEPAVKAIALRPGVTLLSMESVNMWQEIGFLAKVFEVFSQHRVSVGLVSTSESSITVSLDAEEENVDARTLDRLVSTLSALATVKVIRNCAAVSIVGRKIRTILAKLGPSFEVFAEHRLHLVSQAANDLNFTVVVDQAQGYRLVQQLHPAVMRGRIDDDTLGPTWESLQLQPEARTKVAASWWRQAAQPLIEMLGDRDEAFAYDVQTLHERIDGLLGLRNVSAVFYAMKANSHPDLLREVHAKGLGFECVSPGELDRVLTLFPDIAREHILYTPNFCARKDYEHGFALGVHVTLDNLSPLQQWPDTFRNRNVFVRVDPGQGRGHHEHVRTAGVHSKFGVPVFELAQFADAANALSCRVVGVHAHTGSGITNADNWRIVAEALASAAAHFPHVRVLDLGGGLGVPEQPGDAPLDLSALDASLSAVRDAFPAFDIWLEPGRFIVSEAGVLLTRVTQTKGKGDVQYVGVSTGMNSLIRPALYGAYHEIANLSRLDETPDRLATVVGPICETGDKLGTDRWLPECHHGDVMLIANTGAYGESMSSHYNLREPAQGMLFRREG
ncbi:MAG: bifunctional aspartate kinase/diaminopimelate decarboxylase [Pseudomonadota bacterium]